MEPEMTREQAKIELEQRIKARYDAVDDFYKEDTVEASLWARETLTNHEGSGHGIHVNADGKYQDGKYTYTGLVVCSFAKPEWGGDHCGDPMETAAEAIVRAVCEYLCGA